MLCGRRLPRQLVSVGTNEITESAVSVSSCPVGREESSPASIRGYIARCLTASSRIASAPIFFRIVETTASHLSSSISSCRRASFARFERPANTITFKRRLQRPETSGQNALMLLLDPPKPSFEQLLDGKVEFSVLCPNSPVRVGLRLLPKNPSEHVLLTKTIVTATLPSEIEKVKAGIEKVITDPKIFELLELTHLGQIEFSSDELGSVTVDFRRELNPLRWDVKYSGGRVLLNLSEEGDEQVSVVRYNFAKPDIAVKLEFEDCFPDYSVPADGGLIVAASHHQKKGIAILKDDKTKSFKSFSDIGKDDGFKPEFRSWTRTKEDLDTLINLYSVWSTSRTVGGIFSKRDLLKVLDGFVSKIVCLIDDYQWKRCEQHYLAEPVNRRKKQALLFAVSQKQSIRVGLEKLALQERSTDCLLDAFETIFRQEVAPEKLIKPPTSTRVAAVIKKVEPEWFIEFALRLCSRPDGVRHW